MKNYGKFQGVGRGGGGYDKHSLKGHSSGVEGAQAQVPSVGAQGGGECIFSGTTYFGFTFGKSLCLNVLSISRLYSFVFNKSTHFFIYYVGSQGKYGENYSGHYILVFVSIYISLLI